MEMNLPNKLTVLRVLLVPVFLYFLLAKGSYYNAIAVTIFIIASSTDMLDGYIARKYNLVTNFGKFMDPIADKLLVNSALIAMLYLNMIGVVPVIIIICREFIISGFRLVAVEKSIVISASAWGKWKTIVQMIMIVYILFFSIEGIIANIDSMSALFYVNLISNILVVASTILAIVSALDYIIKNIDVLKN